MADIRAPAVAASGRTPAPSGPSATDRGRTGRLSQVRRLLVLGGDRLARRALLALDGFLGLTATVGGLGILLDWWGLTDDLLAGSPFSSYLVPGLALLVMGGSSLGATLAILGRHRLAAPASVAAGLAIIGFEVVQAAVIGLHPLQVVYGALGAVIIALAARLLTRHAWER